VPLACPVPARGQCPNLARNSSRGAPLRVWMLLRAIHLIAYLVATLAVVIGVTFGVFGPPA
jgi:hypothetical protein